ncbi:MAG: UPF0149 family protein [Sulfuricellaceae bacterium]
MQTTTMTEQELDQLENLLAADIYKGEAMMLDALQGFLCAVISSPETIPANVWIAEVLGELDYESSAQTQEIEALLMKFHDSIATALANNEGFDLILYGAENPDELDFASWSDGYVYGSQIGDADWFDEAGEYNKDLSEKMEIFFLLNGMIKEDALRNNEPWMSAKEEKKLLAQAQENMPGAINAIYRFWRDQSAAQTPMRRASPKVGRNDLCPCGSGKKFKQCCGNEPTLH